MGISSPTTLLKAAAEAVWPDGNDEDSGCASRRLSGTELCGRFRRTRFLAARFATAEVIPTAVRASAAVLRPFLPPTIAINAAIPIQRREWLAASDSTGMTRSRDGE